MPDTTTPISAPGLDAAAGAAGFQRIEVVRVVVDGRTTSATVTGILHRYPRTVPVSLATARRLATAGAPVRVDHVRSGGA